MDIEALQCPRCACSRSRVLETRNNTIRGFHLVIRVRVCDYCGKQFRTKEITDQSVKLPSVSRSKSRRVLKSNPDAPLPSLPENPVPEQELPTTCENDHHSSSPPKRTYKKKKSSVPDEAQSDESPQKNGNGINPFL